MGTFAFGLPAQGRDGARGTHGAAGTWVPPCTDPLAQRGLSGRCSRDQRPAAPSQGGKLGRALGDRPGCPRDTFAGSSAFHCGGRRDLTRSPCLPTEGTLFPRLGRAFSPLPACGPGWGWGWGCRAAGQFTWLLLPAWQKVNVGVRGEGKEMAFSLWTSRSHPPPPPYCSDPSGQLPSKGPSREPPRRGQW